MSVIPRTLAPNAFRTTVTICALAFPSLAQVEWTLVDDNETMARYGPGTGFDATGDRPIMFGGFRAPAKNLSETWLWDGTGWNSVSTPTTPMGRHSFGMSADGTRGVLLFGGAREPLTVLGDTWRYSDGDWQPMFPSPRPASRMGHAMVPTGDQILMFGGHDRNTGTQYGDTWLWTGSGWARRFPSRSPPARSWHAMASDQGGRVLLFGGRDTSRGNYLGDTWEWTDNNWNQLTPTTSPPALASAGMAHDPVRDRFVLFGGSGPTEAAETWEWDGATWMQRFPAEDLPPRDRAGMFYDPRGEVVLIGGAVMTDDGDAISLADTWVYAATDPAEVISFGEGCPGTAGTPNLAPLLGARPWLGETFSMQLTGLPLGSPSLLLLGFSNSDWNGLPLPSPLDTLGLPGCTAYTSADSAVPLANLAGAAIWVVNVPNVPALVGRSLYAQAAVPDPTANAFGATTSNAAEILFGVK